MLRLKQKNFLKNFLITSLLCFLAKCSIHQNVFREKIAHLKSAKKMPYFLIVGNASLATTFPDVCTTYMMCMTIPVTVAKAESSFSKLKLMKNFLRSSMSQKRLNALSLLSIENELAKNLDFRKVIRQFASAKTRRKISSFQPPASK